MNDDHPTTRDAAPYGTEMPRARWPVVVWGVLFTVCATGLFILAWLYPAR